MIKKSLLLPIAAVTIGYSTAAIADDLTYVVDESVSYTEACGKGWYLTEQKEPIFSRGLPPYEVTSHLQFQDQGVTAWQSRIENLPTDFGARTQKHLQDVRYMKGISESGQVSYSEVPVGYIVATKHVGLEGNMRKTCVYAESSEVDGYTLHQSPVSGSYQRPKILIRRFIGEVESGRNSWVDVNLGGDDSKELSLKVDVSSVN